MTDAWDLALFAGLSQFIPNYAWTETNMHSGELQTPNKTIDLVIEKTPFEVNGQRGSAVTINGLVPGPLLRFREGQEAIIRVTNKLEESTSIHWHGILVPPQMDGVPGVSFAGIKPGETFTYRFTLNQSGTYWYHGHSGGQELQGLYGPIIIDPIMSDSSHCDRDYVVVLSDWSFTDPMTIIAKLKKQGSYFNYQKRTMGDFVKDVKRDGLSATYAERWQWGKMRMNPTDISDITGAAYTYLINGLSPDSNWTGIFRKGERLRLRFIDAGAMTLFDVRIPGLKMTVVQADGQNITPMKVDEFRIGPGETYDVIVEPQDEGPYAIFAESIDRSGYAIGTLATTAGAKALVPARRTPPLRSMEDMGMPMSNMPKANSEQDMPGMEMAKDAKTADSDPVKHGANDHGVENSSVPEETKTRLRETGMSLDDNKRRVLVYADLKSNHEFQDQRNPSREIELHLTGNMERYMWSIDGKKYSEAKEPIPFHFGERLRLTLVNDTMMEHPMHLHGMWMYLENGAGKLSPRKHTVIVKPAERLSVAISADALGNWAFHCHLLIHMEMGMFRVVRVAKQGTEVKS